MSRRHTKRERKYWVHSDPDPAPDFTALVVSIVDEHVALDGAQACVLGCRARGQHLPDCPCHDACPPEHVGHCKGCAPREAHGSSLLCGSCFHRRLRSPIQQTSMIAAWLEQNLGGIRAVSYQPRISANADEAPIPIEADIHDHLTEMRSVLAGWARQVAEKITPADSGPGGTDVSCSAAYLDKHAGWLSGQAWVVDLMGSVTGLLNVAGGLVPWEAHRVRLPLPCTQCQQMTLVLYGGQDWVTCVNPACDNIIGWGRYQRLVRQIAALHDLGGRAVGQ